MRGERWDEGIAQEEKRVQPFLRILSRKTKWRLPPPYMGAPVQLLNSYLPSDFPDKKKGNQEFSEYVLPMDLCLGNGP